MTGGRGAVRRGLLVVVVAVLAVGGWALLRPRTTPAAPNAGSTPAASATQTTPPASGSLSQHPLTRARVSALEADLTSGNPARVAAALMVPRGQPLDPALAPGLKRLAPLRIEQSSFTQSSSELATVHLTVGAQRTPWDATLAWDGTTWRVAFTTPRK